MIRHDSVTGEIEVLKETVPDGAQIHKSSGPGLFDLPAEIRTQYVTAAIKSTTTHRTTIDHRIAVSTN